MTTFLIVSGVLFWLCAGVVLFGIWLVGWGEGNTKDFKKGRR